MGVKAMNLVDESKLITLQVVKEEDDLMIINKSGITIRMHVDVIKETKNRATQGTKVIELKKRNDSISHVCVVPRSEDEDEAQVEPAQENVAEPQENINDYEKVLMLCCHTGTCCRFDGSDS